MRFERRIGLGPIELRCERDFFFIHFEVYRKAQKHRRIVWDGNRGFADADCRQQDTNRTRVTLCKARFFITSKIRRTEKSYVHHNKNCEFCQYDFGKHAIGGQSDCSSAALCSAQARLARR